MAVYHPAMVAGSDFRIEESFQIRSVVRADLAVVDESQWWGSGTPLAGAKGRGGACVLEFGGRRGVARDFRRGGMLGGILSTSYFDRRRPERELRILATLRVAGVPVVSPLAALARRHLLVFHRLRLITELVAGATPLPAFVADRPEFRARAVQEAGRVTAMALDAGLHHRDLHPDNLIARIEDGRVEVFLLDLDRATLAPVVTTAGRDRMLVRMARYLRRHEADLPVRSGLGDRLRFLRGTGLDRGGRRQAIARMEPLYQRSLRRHGLG